MHDQGVGLLILREVPLMLIKVTDEDIRLGVRDSPCKCPIARAAMRAFRVKRVIMMTSRLRVYHSRDRCINMLVPDSAKDFVIAFDDGESVSPFEFYVKDVKG